MWPIGTILVILSLILVFLVLYCLNHQRNQGNYGPFIIIIITVFLTYMYFCPPLHKEIKRWDTLAFCNMAIFIVMILIIVTFMAYCWQRYDND